MIGRGIAVAVGTIGELRDGVMYICILPVFFYFILS